jgi:hypothetical protein
VIVASFDDGVDAGVDAGAVTAAGRRDDGRVDERDGERQAVVEGGRGGKPQPLSLVVKHHLFIYRARGISDVSLQ